MAHTLQLWSVLTNLGGVSVTLLAAAALAAYLLAFEGARAALQWCLLFGAGLGLVLASKVAFIGWGIGIPAWDFAGFSGHAMRAAALMPVLLFLMARRRPRAMRVGAAFSGAALAALVAWSRVVLRHHSVSEAAGGYLLGLVLAWLAIRGMRRAPGVVQVRLLLMLCLMFVMPAPLPTAPAETQLTQRWITSLALALSGHERAFERSDWHHR
jgi:membrane-associated phospholipid phosphatase